MKSERNDKMKPLTSCNLNIRVKKLENETIEKIQFLFRVSKSRYSEKITEKVYTSDSADVSYDSDNNCYTLVFTPDETDLFPENCTVYCDIRPVALNGNVIPVKPISIETGFTLFTRGDADDS